MVVEAADFLGIFSLASRRNLPDWVWAASSTGCSRSDTGDIDGRKRNGSETPYNPRC